MSHFSDGKSFPLSRLQPFAVALLGDTACHPWPAGSCSNDGCQLGLLSLAWTSDAVLRGVVGQPSAMPATWLWTERTSRADDTWEQHSQGWLAAGWGMSRSRLAHRLWCCMPAMNDALAKITHLFPAKVTVRNEQKTRIYVGDIMMSLLLIAKRERVFICQKHKY